MTGMISSGGSAVVMSVIWLTAVSMMQSHMCYRPHHLSGARFTECPMKPTIEAFAKWDGTNISFSPFAKGTSDSTGDGVEEARGRTKAMS